jgi:RNA polymerase sigma factor (TIGR02999 family)
LQLDEYKGSYPAHFSRKIGHKIIFIKGSSHIYPYLVAQFNVITGVQGINMAELTTLLRHANESPEASSQLWQAAYESLKHIARARLNGDHRAVALDTGTLVNESYLRMRNVDGQAFPDRNHFFSYASHVMRSVIVDRLRELQANRRGGVDCQHIPFDTDVMGDVPICHEGLEVHAALELLNSAEPRLAKVVEMRYFGGLTDLEIATALDINERTVRRDWNKARLLLRTLLTN